jgi:glycosyltransferase involved in cell wall biosynthesis
MMALECAAELRSNGVETNLFAPDLAVGANARRYWTISAEDLPASQRAYTRLFRTRFPRRLVFSPSLYSALRREAGGYDVIHIHNLWTFPQFASYRQASRQDVPFIVAPCGGLDPLRRDRNRHVKALTTALWQNRMLRDARLIHFKTRAEKERAADVVRSDQAAVVPNGIRWSAFQDLPESQEFRRRHLRGHEGPVIMTIGRLSWEKRLDVLIQAFAQVADEFKDALLVIVGPDDEGLGAELSASASELAVGSRVRFTGALAGDDKLEALAAADLWCSTSQFESFGLAAVEALAAGRPALISDGVQIADEIGAAGAALVTPSSPDPVATGIRRLLRDAPLRHRLSENGRLFAREFDWASIASQLASMYREAAAGAR